MSEHGESTFHIVQSLVVNAVIACAKLAAAIFAGSGAMMAEAIHSFADCMNQILLLIGVRQAKRPPDDKHPLGFGRDMYFWSFMVALLLFAGGGVFSVYEGVHKIGEPEPVDHVGWALGILAFSLALEGWSLFGNLREMKRRRGAKSLFKYLQDTKDSDLVVVFGENLADVLGLFIAFLAIVGFLVTGDARADALGSIAVGVVLVGISVFLAKEVKSLLIGESADVEIAALAVKFASEDPRIESVIHCFTIQQGPGEVLLVIKLKIEPHVIARDLSTTINDLEAKLRAARPECRWIYVEPDVQEWKVAVPTPQPAASTTPASTAS